ncbi:conserved hypothetical protein, partial [Ricinus communis]
MQKPRLILSVLAALVALAPPAHAATVQAWITTGDQSQLLARAPDARLEASADVPTIVVDPSTRYQQIAGFGAAITDASADLIQHLDPARRDALLRQL